jgi:cytochrome c oxidase assembly factor CtaG
VIDAGLAARLALDSLNAIVPAAVYVVAVRRLRRRGDPWPVLRTAAFLAAVALAAVATSTLADAAARRSLAWHMAEQMTLLLVVAPGIVAGRPLELIRRVAWPGAPRPPGPAVAWIAFVGAQWLIHIPAVLAFGLRHAAAYALMHWLLVLAGVVFFAQARVARLHPLVLALYVASAMPTTDAIGLGLILDPHVIYGHYAGSGGLADQQAAGAIMFGAGNILLVVAAWIAGRYLWSDGPDPREARSRSESGSTYQSTTSAVRSRPAASAAGPEPYR